MVDIDTQCLKITEEVSLNIANIASEATFTFWVENAKNCPFLASLWKSKACGQTVLPDMSVLIGPKIGGKCQNSNATFE